MAEIFHFPQKILVNLTISHKKVHKRSRPFCVLKHRNFGQNALLKLPQSLDPSDDVVDDFFGESFFDGGVFCGEACGAVLEQVVEAFVLLEYTKRTAFVFMPMQAKAMEKNSFFIITWPCI